MKRQYFVIYEDNFFTKAYRLRYADTRKDLALVPKDAERITRKEAERLAAEERKRRKDGHPLAEISDSAVYPIREGYVNWLDRNFELVGCVWERRTT